MSASFTAAIVPETEFVRCECCGMTEEYTVVYIDRVRNLYAGKLVCGLCSEAVKYEILRSGKKQRRIGVEEALAIHMRFCGDFVASPPNVNFISAIGEMFRRRLILDLPMVVTSATPLPATVSGSIAAVDGGVICSAAVIGGTCMPALSGGA